MFSHWVNLKLALRFHALLIVMACWYFPFNYRPSALTIPLLLVPLFCNFKWASLFLMPRNKWCNITMRWQITFITATQRATICIFCQIMEDVFRFSIIDIYFNHSYMLKLVNKETRYIWDKIYHRFTKNLLSEKLMMVSNILLRYISVRGAIILVQLIKFLFCLSSGDIYSTFECI